MPPNSNSAFILDTFLTISAPTQSLYKEKGSKFMAFSYPVETEQEVKQCLEILKKSYHDASHHCFAYILGANQEKYRASDDGEPSHSAGTPILGQIRSKNLTDTLVVVVRYFGGTKLGVSGLISAYKTAAANALETAEIIEKTVVLPVNIQYNYEETNEIMRLIELLALKIQTQNFGIWCEMTLLTKKSNLLETQEKFKKWTK